MSTCPVSSLGGHAPRRACVFVLVPLLAACAPSPPTGSHAALASTSLRIAALYVEGGNVGARYDRDAIVLVNASSVPVDLSGHSVQVTSGSGTATFGASSTTRTELPSLVLAPGQALRLGGSVGATGEVLLPDVVDDTPPALATTSGRVALVVGTTPLGCNFASTPCDDAARARVLDLVGYGAAAAAEGSPVAAPTSGSMLARRGHGCVDTDDNAADFEAAAVALRSLAEPPLGCGDAEVDAGPVHVDVGLEGGDATIHDAGFVDADGGVDGADVGLVDGDGGDVGLVDVDGGADGGVDGGVVPAPDASTEATSIRSWLGEGPVRPVEPVFARLRGRVGFVVGARASLEDETAGVVLQGDGVRRLRPGDSVEVEGIVRPVVAADDDVPLPTLLEPRILGRIALPEPAPPVLRDALAAASTDGAPYDLLSRRAVVQPLDVYLGLVGQRVLIEASDVVGPSRAHPDGGRLVTLGLRDGPRDNGFASLDVRAHRVLVLDTPAAAWPRLPCGVRLEGAITGVVDRDRGRFILRAVSSPVGLLPPPNAPSVPGPSPGALHLATLNLHVLSPALEPARSFAIAERIVGALGAPAVLALTELADDSGHRDDATTTADAGVAALVDALARVGAPGYRAVQLAPDRGRDGGAPGANVRVALFVRPDTRVSLEARGCSFPEALRLGVDDPAFDGSRKPLVRSLRIDGRCTTVVVVHLRSHLEDDPTDARHQPPVARSDGARYAQVRALVDTLHVHGTDPSRIVLGDFNDDVAAPALAPLAELGVLPRAPRPTDAPTYVFEGYGRAFDHVYTSELGAFTAYTVPFGGHGVDGPSDHDARLLVLPPRPRTGGGCSVPPVLGAGLGPRAAPRPALLGLLALVLLRAHQRRDRTVVRDGVREDRREHLARPGLEGVVLEHEEGDRAPREGVAERVFERVEVVPERRR